METKTRRRFVIWGVIGVVAIVAFSVYSSVTKPTHEKPIPQTVTRTALVDDDSGFCREYSQLTMSKRVTEPLYNASIMPAEVPDEHFAKDAGAIAVAMNGQYSKAVVLAAAYDVAVQARCGGGN